MIAAVSRVDCVLPSPGSYEPLGHRADGRPALLERYRAADGSARELVHVAAAAGSTLVVDRRAVDATDPRLVAHLAADEPSGNARIVCACYLAERCSRAPCALPRALQREDLRIAPFTDLRCLATRDRGAAARALVDARGRPHQLAPVATTVLTIPELRWLRDPPAGVQGPAELVSVRDVTGALQAYEPVRTLSAEAVARHRDDDAVSVAVLRAELARVAASPIVLNRRLRERVAQSLAREGLSMSEIALRCGRVKRDRRGNISGETSWLARRLGLLPEGGERVPTPWIHSAVLALIARRGLGLCPREVEL